MTDTPSALADRTLRDWAEAASENPVLKARVRELETENWQLRQACGYPIPADKETPQNPFKCGICDARARAALQPKEPK